MLLLQLIGRRNAMRVAGAAKELGVARSTAHRLLVTLKNRGFVVQDKPNGAYRPGPALNEIGLAAIGRMDIRRIARPVIEQLSQSLRETASLLFLEGNHVRFIDCVEGARSVRVGNRTGLVLPAHCTAGGKALLAALADTDLERRYADGQLEARTPSSIATWDELRAEVTHVRDVGYAVNLGEGESGISAVGVAVHDLIGTPVAGIAVAVPASRMSSVEDAARIAPLLFQAQRAINELLRAEL